MQLREQRPCASPPRPPSPLASRANACRANTSRDSSAPASNMPLTKSSKGIPWLLSLRPALTTAARGSSRLIAMGDGLQQIHVLARVGPVRPVDRQVRLVPDLPGSDRVVREIGVGRPEAARRARSGAPARAANSPMSCGPVGRVGAARRRRRVARNGGGVNRIGSRSHAGARDVGHVGVVLAEVVAAGRSARCDPSGRSGGSAARPPRAGARAWRGGSRRLRRARPRPRPRRTAAADRPARGRSRACRRRRRSRRRPRQERGREGGRYARLTGERAGARRPQQREQRQLPASQPAALPANAPGSARSLGAWATTAGSARPAGRSPS